MLHQATPFKGNINYAQNNNSLIELFAKKMTTLVINQQLFNGGVAQLVRARDS